MEVTLDKVLYIPSYPHCLFSVRAATKKGAKFYFADDGRDMIAPDRTTFPIT